MHVFKTLAAAAALAVTAGATQAATYNAISYSDVVEGTCSLAGSARCTADNRKTLGNLVDDNKNTFYSLGLGGSVTLGFGTDFKAGDVSVYEITFTRPTSTDKHYEAFELIALDANKNATGFSTVISNKNEFSSFRIDSGFTYLKLVDVTKREFQTGTTSYDGADIGMVSIAAVPVPAAGVLMLAGLGGLAALRRRRKA
ncbi:VPLPA-CTERM sorting domain-containing protein [Paracoccus sp. (in: a-proteobacteria)]|uniref:VPLPA-CTERM sorting domain-containing protein n=1 Tax=Paracoccus sp. TaxID=267 RepID=UPI0035B09A4C